MIYISHRSGIASAVEAWKGLGWELNFLSEEDEFKRRVIFKNHPNADILPENKFCKDYYGTKTTELVFSTAGLAAFSLNRFREGLDSPADNGSLHLLGILERHAPRWLVWSGVAGTLQDTKGDFRTFLQGLAKLGYGFAYAVLDAQHFGVPQRLRRLYIIAHALGLWQRPAAVLFDKASLRRNPATSGESGDEDESGFEISLGGGGETEKSGSRRIAPRIAAPLRGGSARRKSHSKLTGNSRTTLVIEQSGNDTARCAIRRLAPIEYERLMGLPDDYSKVEWETEEQLDDLRYNAVGESLPVPVLKWIGERIQLVEETVLRESH